MNPSITYSPIEQFEREFVRPQAGRMLIVGSYVTPGKQDRRELFDDAVGIDMRAGPGVDIVLNMEELLPTTLGRFHHVECRSVLEHSRRPWLLARNIERLMWEGATVYFAAPFVWGLHSYPSDYWRFTTDAVRELFISIEWTALRYAGKVLSEGKKTPRAVVGNHIYIERQEVLGFGVKR